MVLDVLQQVIGEPVAGKLARRVRRETVRKSNQPRLVPRRTVDSAGRARGRTILTPARLGRVKRCLSESSRVGRLANSPVERVTSRPARHCFQRGVTRVNFWTVVTEGDRAPRRDGRSHTKSGRLTAPEKQFISLETR